MTTALAATPTLTDLAHAVASRQQEEAAAQARRAEEEAVFKQRIAENEQAIAARQLGTALEKAGIVDVLSLYEFGHKDGRVYAYGQTDIEDLPVLAAVTFNRTSNAGDLEIRIQTELEDGTLLHEQERVVPGPQTPEIVGLMAINLHKRHFDVMQKKAEEAAAEARRQAERAGKLAIAQAVVDAANAYLAARAAFDAHARSWAQDQTDRLWEPWGAWLVETTAEGAQPNEDGELWTEKHLVLDDVEEWRGKPDAAVQAATKQGELKVAMLGAFVGATMHSFEEESITKRLDYHRSTQCGSFWVNVPPWINEDVDVTEAPDLPVDWYTFFTERLPGVDERLTESYYCTTVDSLAGMTAGQVLNDYGYLLSEGSSDEIPF